MLCFVFLEEELQASYWQNKGKQALKAAMNVQRSISRAKNSILFLGDGESENEPSHG